MVANINQSVENCNLCGICNLHCPIYAILKKESVGPRLKAFLAKKKDYKEVFFLCTECGACLQSCPAQIDLECLEIRKQIVEKGAEPPANKIMRENIQKFNNPFGEVKKGKKIARYYT
jgi:Fe-S oxidoreductase